MRIIAAAIKFIPKDSEYPQIVCGKRHCDCLEWMYNHHVEYDKQTAVQGFITQSHGFVDRYEAAEMAWETGQMLSDSDTYKRMKKDIEAYGGIAHSFQLFSEDLW